MNFDILRHELEALSFYMDIAKTAEDSELKKEALLRHSELIKSLHDLEKEYRKQYIELNKLIEGNDKEIKLARLNRNQE